MKVVPHLTEFETERWLTALRFAMDAHGTQERRYTGEPYWTHVVAVATTVSKVPGRTMEMVEAALLHDVLEDTDVDEAELRKYFSETTVDYVILLTDEPLYVGNRAVRKALDVERLAAAPDAVKTVKLADMLDNTATIVEHDPRFAVVYMREKAALLPALKGGDTELFAMAEARVREYHEKVA